MDTEKQKNQVGLINTTSFLVKVQFRQNASWQGTIQWIENGKTQKFRSCLELIRLMDKAVEESDPAGNEDDKTEW